MHTGIEKYHAFKVVGVKYRGTNQQNEIPQLWESFIPRLGEIEDRINMYVSYGVMDNYDPETKEFDYFACVEVSEDATLPEGMVLRAGG